MRTFLSNYSSIRLHMSYDIKIEMKFQTNFDVPAGDGSKKIRGCWDSIHVVEVQERGGGRNAHYKLTSTAMLWLQV